MLKITFTMSVLILTMLLATPHFGQGKTETITLSDPATVSLATLFAQADVVAFIKINSGDARSYKQAIYEAEILDAFKGGSEKQIIYFTPFIGYGVGNEYLAFLKKTDKKIGDLVDDGAGSNRLPYDAAQTYYRIMYDGYSVMPVSYECYFDGKLPDSCDYGVEFNTYQVKLPATLKTFPKNVGDFDENKKWVRKSAVNTVLTRLKNNGK